VMWRGELPRTGVGMLLLAAAGLVPAVGGVLWLATNVAGVGAMVAAILAPRLLGLAVTARGAAAV
jgi:hypothetical protein